MSKRKKHNPVARNARFHSYLVSDLAVYFLAGSHGKCDTVNLKTYKVIPTPYSVASTLSSGRFKWYCLLMVVCKDHFGKPYVPAYDCVAVTPGTQSQIATDLNDKHMQLIAGCNKQHILTVAWMISPHPIEWEEERVMGLLEDTGAFDNLAPWEQTK